MIDKFLCENQFKILVRRKIMLPLHSHSAPPDSRMPISVSIDNQPLMPPVKVMDYGLSITSRKHRESQLSSESRQQRMLQSKREKQGIASQKMLNSKSIESRNA